MLSVSKGTFHGKRNGYSGISAPANDNDSSHELSLPIFQHVFAQFIKLHSLEIANHLRNNTNKYKKVHQKSSISMLVKKVGCA